MTPLTFNDIKRLFTKEFFTCGLTDDGSDRKRRATDYLDALFALETWDEPREDFVKAVNDYRRSLEAISAYIVYATRIKNAPDPMLDVLIDAGRREQSKAVAAFVESVDESERVARTREISRILSKDVGTFIADAPQVVREV